MSFRIGAPSSTPAVSRPAPSAPSTASRTPFGDLVSHAREANRTLSAPSPIAPAITVVPAPSVLATVGRQLLGRVARGERYVENVVHQGLAGRAFTPAELLVMQAHVYRYAQELELVSKLVDHATSSVKTVLQQSG